MNTRKILYADDDPKIREALGLLLGCEGYETVEAASGEEALALFDDSVGLVILDIMMPGMDGYQTCAEIRKLSPVPVLFLTAKSMESDMTMGFSVGGDDYLIKPFSYNDLMNRIKAMLRRYYVYGSAPDTGDSVIRCCGSILIDKDRQSVFCGEEEIIMTDTEYRILLLLASHPNKIFSIQNIYESIWNEPYFRSSNNLVTVHISNIRRKLAHAVDEDRPVIKTVWGKGYRIG